MAREQNVAGYPTTVWSGSSPSRPNPHAVSRRPDDEDWEQAVVEVAAVQQLVLDTIAIDVLEDVENANASEVDILPGTPVVLATATTVDLATNDGTVAAASVVGLAMETITAEVAEPATPAGTGNVQIRGSVSLTTAQWDAVTGGSGGLTPGAYYFVGAAGGLVTAEPSGGDIIAPVGQALTATVMVLRISYPVASSV